MAVTTFSKKKSSADPILARDQQNVLKVLLNQLGMYKFLATSSVWILRKKSDSAEEEAYLQQLYGYWNKRLVPFRLNRMQQEIFTNRTKNDIVLKFRQGGTTTYMIIVELWLPAILEAGTSSLLISQTKGYGAAHFHILRRADRHFLEKDPFDPSKNLISQSFHEHLLHKQFSNRHEIIYDMLDSRVLVDTAENTEVGQGLPGITNLGATEVARWPHIPAETMANVSESVAPEGRKFWESTANGMAGLFFEECQKAKRGESVFKFHFYEWPYAEEYKETDKAERLRITQIWKKRATEQDLEEERIVRERFFLDLEQVAWRRGKKITLGREFYEKYPEDDASCFLSSGHLFFDVYVCRNRYIQCQTNPVFLDVNPSKGWVLYKRYIPGRLYILYGDVAEGKTITTADPDFSHAVVIDEESGEVCARYNNRILPEDYAYDLLNIAQLFGGCLIGVENNPGGGGETVLVTLASQLGYGNIFKFVMWSVTEKKPVEVPGLPMTSRTRPFVLNKLELAVRESPELFPDELFWSQCLTFAVTPKGRPEAQEGYYDDAVMANAGAQFCRLVRKGWVDPLLIKKEAYGKQEEP